ncbi:glutamine--fructose-6-phosphate transaminase (isomerizing) [Halorarius litoreus]|uniref:glutamine--fructose-6-phosphate transaminase (isomerizing) n=1 Tax=Halorarius litoreus TaxID=2962676 RepID=UPI0020CB8D89|nr:glutamine--fructose-6-phosphate transaminase (isomerizing) [Halorarius litoreus]
MCGITGCVGQTDAAADIMRGLQNLEYRGYDSAGLAVRNGAGIEVFKQSGEVGNLRKHVGGRAPLGHIAIGHTRWSTHGPPTDANAHPHVDCTGTVAVVHNGIINNYDSLRERLRTAGHVFTSDTDTEVVPHLIERYLSKGHSPETAFRRALDELEGSYALAVLIGKEDTLYAARSGSPLVLGIGESVTYLASDVPAFLEFTDQVVYLDDGDVAIIQPDDYRLTDREGTPVSRPVRTVDWVPEDAEKGGYDHFMLKEIHEQPMTLRQTVRGRVVDGHAKLDDLSDDALAGIESVHLVGCGTSYHASLSGVAQLNALGVPAQAALASEYATNPLPIDDHTLVVGVTQSGETADTLAALRVAKAAGARTLAFTNVIGSTAARECDEALFIRAGPEIGVAATKTFSSQVAALWLLADRISGGKSDPKLMAAVDDLPALVERVIARSNAKAVVEAFCPNDAYFFIGRHHCYPVALEGALKFKEITYEHAEGFAGGELKHGPLALVTEDTPVFAVFSGDEATDEKLLGNVEEVQARGAPVIAVAPERATAVAETADVVLTVPDTHPVVTPVLANVQLQLVAYYAAVALDRAIDKPRNLAKSVTVE